VESREKDKEEAETGQVHREYQIIVRRKKAPMIEIREPKEETTFQNRKVSA